MARSSKGKSDKKRQRKKQEQLRRTTAGSPYRRIGESGGEVTCYVNERWPDDRMAAIHVLRQKRGGGHAMAGFLVDLDCVGLKDAYGELEASHADFTEMIQSRPELELKRVDLDAARRLVAGGIRFAQQNGFRLPPRYNRWTALLGDLGDVDQADISDFAPDGKLCYVGALDDLKRRLIGCSVEEFLAREDVDFISQVHASDHGEYDSAVCGDLPTIDEYADERKTVAAVEESVAQVAEGAIENVRKACFAAGEAPSSRLRDAWEIMTEAMFQGDPPDDEELDASGELQEVWNQRIDEMLAFEPLADVIEIRRALDQIRRFVRSFDSIDDLNDAIGVPSDSKDDEDRDESDAS